MPETHDSELAAIYLIGAEFCEPKISAVSRVTPRYPEDYRPPEQSEGARQAIAKQHAHRVVAQLKSAGLLERKPCEACGKTETIAHHDDYSKPSKIRWICSICHAEWHANNKAAF